MTEFIKMNKPTYMSQQYDYIAITGMCKSVPIAI